MNEYTPNDLKVVSVCLRQSTITDPMWPVCTNTLLVVYTEKNHENVLKVAGDSLNI